VILQLQKLSSQGHLFAEVADEQSSKKALTDGEMTNGLSEDPMTM
jgi:hypothetical protein